MSLIAIATRVVLARILTGRTWATGQILDQPLDPIAEVLRAADGKPKPVIAIYTGEAKGKPAGLETQGGCQNIRMMLYIYLPPAKVTLPNSVAFEIDNVGSGLLLGTLSRQVDAAMHFGNQSWIEVWRRFVLKIDEKLERYVLVEIEHGVKVPCLELIYELDTVADADFAKPLYGAWLQLDTLLRADGAGSEGVLLADHLKSLIEQPANLHDYEVFQGNFGLSDAAFEATGLAPVITIASGPNAGDVPIVTRVDIPMDVEFPVPVVSP